MAKKRKATRKGRVIDSYSRSEAIRDGVLIDVEARRPGLLKEVGFNCSVAFTAEAWAEAIGDDDDELPPGQDVTGRLWDALTLMHIATVARARSNPDAREVTFEIAVQRWANKGRWTTPHLDRPTTLARVQLRAQIGADDDGAPAITVMLATQD